MNQYWENLTNKINGMSLRERVMIFAALAFVLGAVTKSFFLDPLLVEKNKLSAKVQQQQSKMKEVQAQLIASQQAKNEIENSPLHSRLEQTRQQVAQGDVYLQGLRNNLVPPEKMPELLEQVLNQNSRLRLINLQTLPVVPLIEKSSVKPSAAAAAGGDVPAAMDRKVFRHGVQITVRGNYMDLLQYLTQLEQLPTQMFWGKVELKVEQHPEILLTLTLYTLSLDKIWMQV